MALDNQSDPKKAGNLIRFAVIFLLLAIVVVTGGPILLSTLKDTVLQEIGGNPINATATLEPTPVTPTATTLPEYAEVTRNDEWSPVITYINGVAMAKVPPGCFLMGSAEGNDEQPVHQVCFESAFWIDVYEVTNFIYGSHGTWEEPDLPREFLTWFEAYNFCALRGARLPTEAEWEYAARGPDSLIFPWGNTFDPLRVVYSETSDAHTLPVGSRPGGTSWVGAQDMAGSVWEWTNSIAMPYPYNPDDGREVGYDVDDTSMRVTRGGSWGSVENLVRASGRVTKTPDTATYYDGVRCALDDED